MRFERASKKRELSLKTDVKQFCKMLCLVAAQRLRLRSARLLPQLLLLRSLQNTRRCFAINDEATTAASASATSRLPNNNNYSNNSSNVVRSQHYKQKLQTGCVVSSKTNKAKAEDPLSLCLSNGAAHSLKSVWVCVRAQRERVWERESTKRAIEWLSESLSDFNSLTVRCAVKVNRAVKATKWKPLINFNNIKCKLKHVHLIKTNNND